MRSMAFSATIAQVLGASKACTRRKADGTAAQLKPGALLRAVDQLSWLGSGRHARTLAVLRVVDVRPAPPITPAEVLAEGFEGKSTEFVEGVLRKIYGDAELVRVGFTYVAIAAPRLEEVTRSAPLLALRRDVGNAAAGRLASLRKGEAACADLRSLRDLAARETLLEPEAHRRACEALGLNPMDLWRAPRKARERPADEQRDLFA